MKKCIIFLCCVGLDFIFINLLFILLFLELHVKDFPALKSDDSGLFYSPLFRAAWTEYTSSGYRWVWVSGGCDDDYTFVRVRAIVQFPSCAARRWPHVQSYANQMRLETHLHTIRPVDHQAWTSSRSDSQRRSTLTPFNPPPNKGTVCIFWDSVFILYPLAACAPCCFRPRHRRFKWRGPYGTDGPARSPLNPADFPRCLHLLTHILHPDTWWD